MRGAATMGRSPPAPAPRGVDGPESGGSTTAGLTAPGLNRPVSRRVGRRQWRGRCQQTATNQRPSPGEHGRSSLDGVPLWGRRSVRVRSSASGQEAQRALSWSSAHPWTSTCRILPPAPRGRSSGSNASAAWSQEHLQAVEHGGSTRSRRHEAVRRRAKRIPQRYDLPRRNDIGHHWSGTLPSPAIPARQRRRRRRRRGARGSASSDNGCTRNGRRGSFLAPG